MEIRDIRYARAPDGTYLAYAVVGDGPVDIAWQNDWFSDLDLMWEYPRFREWVSGLAAFARVILHDRRGLGLSSRTMPGDLETRVADLRTVLRAVGAERPVVAGAMEGGAPNALMAASDPMAVRSLVWFAPSARSLWAPDYPWGVSDAYVASDLDSITQHWGTAEYGEAFIRTEALVGHRVAADEAELMSLMSRHTCTPDMALELSRNWYDTDLRSVLPLIQVPTLILSPDEEGPDTEADYVARAIPGAVLTRVPDPDLTRDWGPSLDAIRSFVGVERPPVGLDTILATVLFTDIVGSTERQAELGDRGWKQMVERHHELVRRALERWHGVERDTAGDGFFATFDGPARAVRCALEVSDRVRALGLEIRAGVHTGECEIVDRKVGGLAVSIGARIAATAQPSEVLVSQTVKDLVAGSGLGFADGGEHRLKGVPDRWRLYRVVGA
jgi:class 3 adenylate cyclase